MLPRDVPASRSVPAAAPQGRRAARPARARRLRRAAAAPVLATTIVAAIAGSPAGDAPRPPAGTSVSDPGPAVLTGDARGPSLAARVDRVLGGETLRRMGYLGFVCRVELDGRSLAETQHRVDLRSGRHRVRWTDASRRRLDALLEPGGGGRVTRDGESLSGDEAAAALEEARHRRDGDTYWLLMPFKLHDPGVRVADGGAETLEDGRIAPVLELSFEPGTGPTPGDRYRVWIDPDSLRVDRWVYRPEGRQEELTALWRGWQDAGGVWLSTEKIFPEGVRVLRFTGVTLDEEPPPDAFVAREADLGDPAAEERREP